MSRLDLDLLKDVCKVEIRPSVTRTGAPKLVSYGAKYQHVGFTSVYGYPLEAQKHIESTSSTRGLSKFAVYSDTLYVDFDNEEEAAENLEMYLLVHGYAFERYHSGGRSIHFHIPIVPMYGINVPHSQKLWIERYAPKADVSIYRHTGLYRLPGTYHVKNPGNKKRMEVAHNGPTKLKIENVPRGVTVQEEEEVQNPEFFYNVLGKLLHRRMDQGGRHKHAFKIAMAGKAAQLPRDRVESLLRMWNNTNCFPSKEDWEITKLMRWVYND